MWKVECVMCSVWCATYTLYIYIYNYVDIYIASYPRMGICVYVHMCTLAYMAMHMFTYISMSYLYTYVFVYVSVELSTRTLIQMNPTVSTFLASLKAFQRCESGGAGAGPHGQMAASRRRCFAKAPSNVIVHR